MSDECVNVQLPLVRTDELDDLRKKHNELVLFARFPQLDLLTRSLPPQRCAKLTLELDSLVIATPYEPNATMNEHVRLFFGDITRLRCSAIVNSCHSTLKRGGGLDGAIQEACGSKLQDQLALIAAQREGGCLDVAETVITDTFDMTHVSKIIHVCVPSILRDDCLKRLGDCVDNVLDSFCRQFEAELGGADAPVSIGLPCLGVGIKSIRKVPALLVMLQCVRAMFDRRIAAGQTLPIVVLCILEIENECVFNRLLPKVFPSA